VARVGKEISHPVAITEALKLVSQHEAREALCAILRAYGDQVMVLSHERLEPEAPEQFSLFGTDSHPPQAKSQKRVKGQR
jgi:flagellar biosynthesis component FlhA